MHEDVDQQKLAVYKRCMKARTDAIKEYLAEFIEKNAVLAPQGATADGPKNEIWRTAETLAPHSTRSSCDLPGAGPKLKSNAG